MPLAKPGRTDDPAPKPSADDEDREASDRERPHKTCSDGTEATPADTRNDGPPSPTPEPTESPTPTPSPPLRPPRITPRP